MKISEYNLEEQIEGKTVIYNTLSGGILVLNADYSEMYNNLIRNNNFDELSKELRENLEKGMMIIPEDIDEIEMIKAHNTIERYSNKGLCLTIAPTLECNFRCPYCYERGRNYNTMSEKTIDSTIKYINDNSKKKEHLSIAWYGGEPLLAVNIIEKITRNIENKKDLGYQAVLITNGYLLTKDIALKLKQLNVNNVQITIDGPPEIHNKRRKLPNGGDTFSVIFDNIKQVCDILAIRIRVNVDKRNINTVDEILQYIKEFDLLNKVGLYLAPVDNINGTCNSSTCFNSFEFSEEEISFYQRSLKKGIMLANIPRYSPGICCAVSKDNVIIDPLGDIYKCWNEIGDINAKIGDINSGVSFKINYTKWLNYNFGGNECSKCKILPVCLGGCPFRYINNGERMCHPLKFKFAELVNLIYQYKQTNLPI